MLTRPGKSEAKVEAEARCHEAKPEVERKLRPMPRQDTMRPRDVA